MGRARTAEIYRPHLALNSTRHKQQAGPINGAGFVLLSPRERSITVASHVAAGWLEITVEDTGIGIPNEILPKVFDPLFSTRGFGTGLGLAVVKQVVEQHGGKIAIASTPGKGTRVAILLPLDAAASKTAGKIAA